MFRRFAHVLLAAAAVVATSLSATAAVVTEEDGQFSKHWKKPTQIGFGADTVLGTAEKQNAHEFVALTSLAPGAQTLGFGFAAPTWARESWAFAAGGQVLWSADPFRWNWDGRTAGSFQLSRWNFEQSFDLVLGDDFGGALYLGFYFTHGQDVTWRLSVPGYAPAVPSVPSAHKPDAGLAAPAPAPVPLPAGIWLLGGGLSLIGVAGARRRPRAPADRV